MTNIPLRAVLGGSLLLLAGCGEKSTTTTPAANDQGAANASAAGDNMAAMDMSTKATTATGHGTVTAIDPATGKITLDHGPIPAAGWPAMSMAFNAKVAVLKGVSVGQKVSFDLALKDGAGEVTAIRKEP
jgi:Cu/Ag efflux protein CusF